MPPARPHAGLVPLSLLVALLVGACAGAGAPGSSIGATAIPSAVPVPVSSRDEAAAAVGRVNPMLAGIGELDPDMIGQANSWQAVETQAGWDVTFEVGWGDCPAGCISKHVWRYGVTRDGAVSLIEEAGDPLPPDVQQQLGGEVPFGSVTTGVRGLITAGPACPVEQVPPDPACAARPVEGAVLIVRGADGAEAGRTGTDASGFFELALEPGRYTLEPQPVEGLMGTAAPVQFDVVEGATTPLQLEYDTGIR